MFLKDLKMKRNVQISIDSHLKRETKRDILHEGKQCNNKLNTGDIFVAAAKLKRNLD